MLKLIYLIFVSLVGISRSTLATLNARGSVAFVYTREKNILSNHGVFAWFLFSSGLIKSVEWVSEIPAYHISLNEIFSKA